MRALAFSTALVVLALPAEPAAQPVSAQPAAAQPVAAAADLAWEPVSDIDFFVNRPAFDADSTMWIGGARGLLRLRPPYDSTQSWERIRPYIFDDIVALGRDTLFEVYGDVNRSVDGGRTFEETLQASTYLPALIEIPPGVSHAGRLVVAGRRVFVSDDRGATWSEGVQVVETDPMAERLAVVPAGPRAGRVLWSGWWGVALSDDGGQTWSRSALWGLYRFDGHGLAVLPGDPAAGVPPRVAVTTVDVTRPDNNVHVYVSDDGAATWRLAAELDPGHDNVGPGWPRSRGVLPLGGDRVAVVMARGGVWGSEDRGETWARWGQVPGLVGSALNLRWAAVAPTGAIMGSHGEGVWMAAPPAVPAVSSGPPAAAPVGLELAVRPNPATGSATVRLTASAGAAVRVSVFDPLGREVATAERTGPRVSVRFETTTWAAGTYIVRAEAGDAVGTARLTVAR